MPSYRYVRTQTTVGGRPDHPGIVPLTGMATDLSYRESQNHPMRIHRSESRRDRNSAVLHVPDLNLAGPGHFCSVRPSDTKLGK
jgi:hypothetical protein